MLTINAFNVNDAFDQALWLMKSVGKKEFSRNGEVMAAPEPVSTTYLRPESRMLFDAKRDANPFFHLMEGVWMLAGMNNVAFPARFATNMLNYSDDGQILNGAYGYRWRAHYNNDQIIWVAEHLFVDPNSRRAVMSMWDPSVDMHGCNVGSKDVPCNTTVYFRRVDGRLNMTVCNRSNDIIWGCYGANAVHMSMLHEYVANCLGWEVGTYTQISNNWHIYERHYHFLNDLVPQEPVMYPEPHIPMTRSGGRHRGMTQDLSEFRLFVMGDRKNFQNKWLNEVGVPVILTHEEFKVRGAMAALKLVDNIKDGAVWSACSKWLERRT